MAPAMSGPTKCSAEPDHGASSTCLPSMRVSRTAGSRAAAAMKSERAADLPAPGSPPEQHVALGQPDRDRVAVLVDARERTGPTASAAGPARAERGPTSGSLRDDRDVGERRVGRVAHAPGRRARPWWRQAISAACSITSALKPGGRRKTSRRPAGIRLARLHRRELAPAADHLAGDEDPANQRRVARSESVEASRRRKTGDRHTAIPTNPRSRTPRPWPSRTTPSLPDEREPEAQGDLEPPPPDGECHPGVGAEGLEVLTLRHRAGAGDGRGDTTAEHQEHDDAEVRQHEADQHQHHQHDQHDPDEPGHQAEALGAIASIFEAENDTPERSAMVQVQRHQVGHLDRGELAQALDVAGDLDGDDLAGPAVAHDEEVDLVDGDALGVESSAAWCRSRCSVRPGRPRRSARRWCQRASA